MSSAYSQCSIEKNQKSPLFSQNRNFFENRA
nr:MAG TPA: hypothetical protein [Caudoviricetes sp.]